MMILGLIGVAIVALVSSKGIVVFLKVNVGVIFLYKLQCWFCNNYYIGKTQQHLKARVWEQFREVWKEFESLQSMKDVYELEGNYNSRCLYGSNAFAKHAAFHVLQYRNSREAKKFLLENIDIEIIWKVNPVSCLKNVGTTRCMLCIQERKATLEAWRKDKFHFLNAKNEIFGACLCKSRFFRFIENGHCLRQDCQKQF